MKLYGLFIIFTVIADCPDPVVDMELPGLLGNRLFAFCIGRIIAKELGFKLYCVPIPGFSYTYKFHNNKPNNKYATQHIVAQHDIDIKTIINNHTPRNIKLQGYFQKYKYLQQYKEKIRKKWLKMDTKFLSWQDPEDIVMHIRNNHPSIYLPPEYYKKALSLTNYKRLFICTDEPNDPYLNNFKEYNPIIHSTRSLEEYMSQGISWPEISAINLDDFGFICSFKKIILSQSTYAWWAGFLSEATEIYAPYCSDEYYQVYGKINEERYHYIDTIIGKG